MSPIRIKSKQSKIPILCFVCYIKIYFRILDVEAFIKNKASWIIKSLFSFIHADFSIDYIAYDSRIRYFLLWR